MMNKTSRESRGEEGGGVTYDTIDGNDLAKDDAICTHLASSISRKRRYLCRPNKILGPYARGPDTTAEDGRASDEDAPVE